MSTTLIVLVVVIALLVVLVVVGEQATVRYPEYFSLVTTDNRNSLTRRLKYAQFGAFVALDAASDLVFAGERSKMLDYKKNKRSV